MAVQTWEVSEYRAEDDPFVLAAIGLAAFHEEISADASELVSAYGISPERARALMEYLQDIVNGGECGRS